MSADCGLDVPHKMTNITASSAESYVSINKNSKTAHCGSVHGAEIPEILGSRPNSAEQWNSPWF